jgi:hypothetical protein
MAKNIVKIDININTRFCIPSAQKTKKLGWAIGDGQWAIGEFVF